MTTLNEDLARMQKTLAHFTAEDVEVVDDSVYVNYGHREAVVVTPEITPMGRRWFVTLMAWDRTGGVSDEKELGDWAESGVPVVVTKWLHENEQRNRALEQMMGGGE